jgi:general transcription factor 3C polypeptide 3 (transcription factor C subunit 4)
MLPDDPIINLCLGVAYLSHATSRNVGDRHACILKSFAFFVRYATVAGSADEAAFNIGRAFQHLELNNLAAEWYQRAILLGQGKENGVAFESGHNLALIYEASGAWELAKHVRNLYCSV